MIKYFMSYIAYFFCQIFANTNQNIIKFLLVFARLKYHFVNKFTLKYDFTIKNHIYKYHISVVYIHLFDKILTQLS